MKALRLALGLAAAAALALPAAPAAAQATEQFIPSFSYRTGPFAPNGIPFADGFIDYLKMINARDQGINGVRIAFEECETAYNTDRGVECYERMKPRGITAVCSTDGRVTLMMPHPERVFRSVQLSWRPRGWGEDSPWMRLFRNARRWVG